MTTSHLDETLSRLSVNAASSVIARGRLASLALNATLLRRLSAKPGSSDSLLADPVFEAARTWESADCNLDDLSGELLCPDLVAALDGAGAERMPRNLNPWSHQLAAWEAARKGLSCLVSSGTGSGKTECFMVPMLDDLLRDPAKGKLTGVRAILIYPLNALIESQRERLAAWTETLKGRISFALYNGLTPETPRGENRSNIAAAEIGNRRGIRETPPAVLVTNVTMLEYLLLRTQDRTILERSKGLLRWIVLDEAHSYIGAQAAEMALLLRRVRAAFGVEPDQVRLMATSATISEGEGTKRKLKLKRFISDLAGLDKSHVRVIEGRAVEPDLPPTQENTPLDPEGMEELDSTALWEILAPHPRIRILKQALSEQSVTLTEVAKILFGSADIGRKAEAQALLDAAAQATCAATGARLLPWTSAYLSPFARRTLDLRRCSLSAPGSGTVRRWFGLGIRRSLAQATRYMRVRRPGLRAFRLQRMWHTTSSRRTRNRGLRAARAATHHRNGRFRGGCRTRHGDRSPKAGRERHGRTVSCAK